MGLSQDEIALLLGTPVKQETATIVRPQYKSKRNTKHVTWHDKEMRCVSRRCGAPTVIKVFGAPTCTIHAILRLAEMLENIKSDNELQQMFDDKGDDWKLR